MSKIYLRKILSLIRKDKESEEDIRRRVNNMMDVGRITEDEACVIDFVFKEKYRKIIEKYRPDLRGKFWKI
ncbi:MAG: hypothetical protein Q8M92_04870 [Candidatus Subteraquimicrobiales bacterium]|nr:hypothetical protein [Candidatus Subteraquimicrobiales bacterium]